jgi:PilZ domain
MPHGHSTRTLRRADISRDLSAQSRLGTTPTEHNVRLLRQFDRRRTSLRAILYRGDAFQSTVIRDVSKGGVGLEGGMSLLPGDKIHLQLMSGHRYRGTVRWWCNGHCGVSFDRLLAADDVLLIAAEKKAR